MEYLLEMNHITKTFPGVKALDSVSLKVRKGEVHALMGENGAGKSTLMKVLNGMESSDSGEIVINGENLKLNSPSDAIHHGIAMIHQELNPVMNLRVMDNIYLGREPQFNRVGWMNKKKLRVDTMALLKSLGIRLDINKKMKDLTISNMQVVEIAKAISYDSDIIIMDEPTSAITEQEVDNLFNLIRLLKQKGVSVIYITHKIDEVFKIADHVTVLRDGCFVDSAGIEDLTKQKLVSMMVGRELSSIFPKENVDITEPILEVKNLTRKGHYKNVSFHIKRGEIFGITGLLGAGRTEVCETIAGITQADSGEILKEGRVLTLKNPQDAIRNKIGIATEDRKYSGLFLSLSVKDNIAVSNYDKFISKEFVKDNKLKKTCSEMVTLFNIKTTGLGKKVKFLSGGNQQKIILARLLLQDPDIIILDEPTRGIDVGAKAEIHKIMTKLVQQGKAVIMISSEMPEIIGMSDRIMVMNQGEVAGILSREEGTQERIFSLGSNKKGDKNGL